VRAHKHVVARAANVHRRAFSILCLAEGNVKELQRSRNSIDAIVGVSVPRASSLTSNSRAPSGRKSPKERRLEIRPKTASFLPLTAVSDPLPPHMSPHRLSSSRGSRPTRGSEQQVAWGDTRPYRTITRGITKRFARSTRVREEIAQLPPSSSNRYTRCGRGPSESRSFFESIAATQARTSF